MNTKRRFLSTLSLRRATHFVDDFAYFFCISIHALLAESDRGAMPDQPLRRISIHALLAESDLAGRDAQRRQIISIHALLAESDSKSAQNSGALLRI